MPCTAKKTTQLIVEHGNDYVITVKGNQPLRYFTSYKPFVKKINLLNDLLMSKKNATVSPAASSVSSMISVRLTAIGQGSRVLSK
jgi:hypothetical protein